jgi:hypothetical protein
MNAVNALIRDEQKPPIEDCAAFFDAKPRER